MQPDSFNTEDKAKCEKSEKDKKNEICNTLVKKANIYVTGQLADHSKGEHLLNSFVSMVVHSLI